MATRRSGTNWPIVGTGIVWKVVTKTELGLS